MFSWIRWLVLKIYLRKFIENEKGGLTIESQNYTITEKLFVLNGFFFVNPHKGKLKWCTKWINGIIYSFDLFFILNWRFFFGLTFVSRFMLMKYKTNIWFSCNNQLKNGTHIFWFPNIVIWECICVFFQGRIEKRLSTSSININSTIELTENPYWIIQWGRIFNKYQLQRF